jgi:hypothetical protein
VVPTSAPMKTPDGQAELATRARRLSQRHRTMLFLVDGRRSEAQIKHLAEQAGAPATCYDELLAMGLIMVPQLTQPVPLDDLPATDESLHIELPIPEPAAADSVSDESVLPAARSLQPESTLNTDPRGAEAWGSVEAAQDEDADVEDPALEEARDMLLRAVRAEAPVAGSLTLMRLRRATSRDELDALLDEVEARLRKPHRMLATTLLMRRVRQLLGLPANAPTATP